MTTTTRPSRNWNHKPHVDAKGKTTGAITIGEGNYSYNRQVTMLNPTERTAYNNWGGRGKSTQSFVLWFGACAPTRLHVYAPHLEDALDACVDWLADYAPGLLADEQVHEEYNQLMADRVAAGADPEDEDVIEACRTEAESDTTSAGNEGNYLLSYEWGIDLENPTTDELYAFITGR